MPIKKVGLKAVFETAEFQRGIVIYNQGVVNVNNAAKKAEGQSKRSSQNMATSWQKSFKAIATYAATAIAAYKSLQGVIEMAGEAAQARNIEQSFYSMASAANVSADELVAAMDKAAGGTIDNVKLMRIANRAFLADAQGTFAQSLPQLMEIARAASLATGQSFEYVFDTLVTGIAKGSPLLIDNAEIYLKLGQAVEEYAKKQNKAVDALTPAERRYATLFAVLEQGSSITERLGEDFEDQTAPMAAVGAEWTNLRRELGENFLPIVQDISKNLIELMENLSAGAQQIRELVAMAHAGHAAINAFGESLAGPKKGLDALADWDAEGFLGPMEQLEAWGALITGNFEDNEVAARAYENALSALDATMARYSDTAREVAGAAPAAPPEMEVEPPDYTEAAEALAKQFDRIQNLHQSYLRGLEREEEDAARERARAWATYDKQVQKTLKQQQERLDDITERYEEQRADTIKDAQKSIAEAEKNVYQDRLKAREDFERQQRQEEERYQLDRLQSERRYQYEWARTLAEGDALALYYLQQAHDLEQQEAAESQDLQQRQAEEGYEAQIKDMEDAGQELVDGLRQSLREQLAEQEQAYREQIEKQKETNQEQLAEIATNFAEQQGLRDEDRALSARRREEDYERQLMELGANLADQEKLQEVGADQVSTLLDEYWGAAGINDEIMAGWHEREAERIAITAEQLALLAAAMPAEAFPAGAPPMAHPVHGMQRGGILRGPAYAYVEPGMVEAFVPLGGGTINVGGNIGVGVTGLERAMPSLVNQVAAQVGAKLLSDITSEIRTRRRS